MEPTLLVGWDGLGRSGEGRGTNWKSVWERVLGTKYEQTNNLAESICKVDGRHDVMTVRRVPSLPDTPLIGDERVADD